MADPNRQAWLHELAAPRATPAESARARALLPAVREIVTSLLDDTLHERHPDKPTTPLALAELHAALEVFAVVAEPVDAETAALVGRVMLEVRGARHGSGTGDLHRVAVETLRRASRPPPLQHTLRRAAERALVWTPEEQLELALLSLPSGGPVLLDLLGVAAVETPDEATRLLARLLRDCVSPIRGAAVAALLERATPSTAGALALGVVTDAPDLLPVLATAAVRTWGPAHAGYYQAAQRHPDAAPLQAWLEAHGHPVVDAIIRSDAARSSVDARKISPAAPRDGRSRRAAAVLDAIAAASVPSPWSREEERWLVALADKPLDAAQATHLVDLHHRAAPLWPEQPGWLRRTRLVLQRLGAAVVEPDHPAITTLARLAADPHSGPLRVVALTSLETQLAERGIAPPASVRAALDRAARTPDPLARRLARLALPDTLDLWADDGPWAPELADLQAAWRIARHLEPDASSRLLRAAWQRANANERRVLAAEVPPELNAEGALRVLVAAQPAEPQATAALESRFVAATRGVSPDRLLALLQPNQPESVLRATLAALSVGGDARSLRALGAWRPPSALAAEARAAVTQLRARLLREGAPLEVGELAVAPSAIGGLAVARDGEGALAAADAAGGEAARSAAAKAWPATLEGARAHVTPGPAVGGGGGPAASPIPEPRPGDRSPRRADTGPAEPLRGTPPSGAAAPPDAASPAQIADHATYSSEATLTARPPQADPATAASDHARPFVKATLTPAHPPTASATQSATVDHAKTSREATLTPNDREAASATQPATADHAKNHREAKLTPAHPETTSAAQAAGDARATVRYEAPLTPSPSDRASAPETAAHATSYGEATLTPVQPGTERTARPATADQAHARPSTEASLTATRPDNLPTTRPAASPDASGSLPAALGEGIPGPPPTAAPAARGAAERAPALPDPTAPDPAAAGGHRADGRPSAGLAHGAAEAPPVSLPDAPGSAVSPAAPPPPSPAARAELRDHALGLATLAVGAESGWAAVPALLTLASLGATVGSGLSFGHAVAAVAFSGAWLFLHHVADTRGLLTTLTRGSPAVGRAAAVHTSAGWRVEVDLLGDDGVRHRHLLPTHHLEADPALPLRLRSDAQGRPAHVVAPTRLRTVRGDRHGGLHPTAVSYAILIAAALAPWIGLAIGAATP